MKIINLLLATCLCGCDSAFAFEPDGGSYSRQQYEAKQRTLRKVVRHRAEPVTTVDRHVMTYEDALKDEQNHVSAEPRKPNVVYVDRIVFVERQEPKVSVVVSDLP